MQQTIMDYFADVYRLKEFHKIVAYEVYWILRRKPIQIKYMLKPTDKMFVNEGFATTFVAHEYLVPEEMEPLGSEKEEAYLKCLQHIYYHFKYRSIDKQCLELMLYSFETGKFIA